MRQFLAIGALSALAIGAVPDQPPKQKPPTRDQLEQLETLDKLRSAVEGMGQAIESIARKRRIACLKAFGHDGFCHCLNERLAIGVTFDVYIAAVTGTNEARLRGLLIVLRTQGGGGEAAR